MSPFSLAIRDIDNYIVSLWEMAQSYEYYYCITTYFWDLNGGGGPPGKYLIMISVTQVDKQLLLLDLQLSYHIITHILYNNNNKAQWDIATLTCISGHHNTRCARAGQTRKSVSSHNSCEEDITFDTWNNNQLNTWLKTICFVSSVFSTIKSPHL